jgi:hypothetical protein
MSGIGCFALTETHTPMIPVNRLRVITRIAPTETDAPRGITLSFILSRRGRGKSTLSLVGESERGGHVRLPRLILARLGEWPGMTTTRSQPQSC